MNVGDRLIISQGISNPLCIKEIKIREFSESKEYVKIDDGKDCKWVSVKDLYILDTIKGV